MRAFRSTAFQQEVARRQGSPYTGKLSARPAGKPGGFSSLKESLRRSPPATSVPAHSINTEAPQYAFFEGMAESIWSDGVPNQDQNQTLSQDRAASRRSAPSPGKRNATGGPRSFSSSADEFRPAIPRSGWSPPEPVSASPARPDYHALPAWHLKTGTFYFAGNRNFLLCLDSQPIRRNLRRFRKGRGLLPRVRVVRDRLAIPTHLISTRLRRQRYRLLAQSSNGNCSPTTIFLRVPTRPGKSCPSVEI